MCEHSDDGFSSRLLTTKQLGLQNGYLVPSAPERHKLFPDTTLFLTESITIAFLSIL